ADIRESPNGTGSGHGSAGRADVDARPAAPRQADPATIGLADRRSALHHFCAGSLIFLGIWSSQPAAATWPACLDSSRAPRGLAAGAQRMNRRRSEADN